MRGEGGLFVRFELSEPFRAHGVFNADLVPSSLLWRVLPANELVTHSKEEGDGGKFIWVNRGKSLQRVRGIWQDAQQCIRSPHSECVRGWHSAGLTEDAPGTIALGGSKAYTWNVPGL